jgi:hypothetical protein
MMLINEFVQGLSVLGGSLAELLGAIDPVSTLYGLLAGTYGRAAVAAGVNDHHALGRCYLVSAALHGLIGVCHHLHI